MTDAIRTTREGLQIESTRYTRRLAQKTEAGEEGITFTSLVNEEDIKVLERASALLVFAATFSMVDEGDMIEGKVLGEAAGVAAQLALGLRADDNWTEEE